TGVQTCALPICTPEGDALQDGNVVADHRGLADDEAGGVVEHDAAADAGGRIDVDLEHLAGTALQVERKVAAAVQPQGIGEAVRLDRLVALEIEERVQRLVAGRVALERRREVRPRFRSDLRTQLESILESLSDQVSRHVRVVEAFGYPMRKSGLEGIVVEDAR